MGCHCQKIVDKVIVNFMIPGHNKFSVDLVFGVKKKYIIYLKSMFSKDTNLDYDYNLRIRIFTYYR